MAFLKTLGVLAIGVVAALGGFFANHTATPQSAPLAGSFTPVQGQTYTLSGAGINSSVTSVTLNSFKTPDGRNLTMAMFGAIGYAVIDPNSPTKIEDITFTGITQNSNGTAVLTGVSRGMDFVTPYTASTTLAQSHSGGSYLILSNSAGFYGQQFLFANTAGSSTQTLTFSNTAPPFYYPGPGAQSTGSPISTTSEFASIAYVNTVTTSGAPNATNAVKGILQIATALQSASSTSLGSTGASLALTSLNATDTPQRGCAVGFSATGGAGCTVVADLTGHIKQGWIDLTQTFNFSGLLTFSSGFLNTASSTFNAGTLHIGSSVVPQPYFGGTGLDGALTISSGTTTVALGTAGVYEKDYTSISITGTGSLNFSSAATSSSGVTIILRSQGACTFTSSSMTMIDLRWLGGGVGTGQPPTGTGGSAGAGGGGSTAGAGSGGGSVVVNSGTGAIGIGGAGGVALPALASTTRFAPPGGDGGNAGNGLSKGGGGLYIECAGAYTFTTGGFNAAGQNGIAGTINANGGSGPGGGGNMLVFYGSLVSDTGTYNTTAGSAGAGGGGGPSSQSSGGAGAGSHLEAKNTYFY